MEGSSPEDLSVGPSIWKEVGLSVINRSRTLTLGAKNIARPVLRTPRKKKKDSKTEWAIIKLRRPKEYCVFVNMPIFWISQVRRTYPY